MGQPCFLDVDAEAINVMLWRMEQDVDRKALAHARQKVDDIRDCITGYDGIDHEKLQQILDQVAELERKLHQVGQAGAIKDERKKSKYWAFPDRR